MVESGEWQQPQNWLNSNICPSVTKRLVRSGFQRFWVKTEGPEVPTLSENTCKLFCNPSSNMQTWKLTPGKAMEVLKAHSGLKVVPD